MLTLQELKKKNNITYYNVYVASIKTKDKTKKDNFFFFPLRLIIQPNEVIE